MARYKHKRSGEVRDLYPEHFRDHLRLIECRDVRFDTSVSGEGVDMGPIWELVPEPKPVPEPEPVPEPVPE